MNLRNCGLCAVLALALVAPLAPSKSVAQTVRPDVARELGSFSRRVLVPTPTRSQVMLQARDTRNDLGPDVRPRTPTVPLNETSALSSFRLGFANGDHHVRQITVQRIGNLAQGVLADNNGDDNFTFLAAWWNMPGAVAGEVSGTLVRTWDEIDIPAGPPNTSLAIAGFSIRSSSDAEIYGIELTLIPERLKARFRLELAQGSSAEKDYVIQYVWIPNALVDGPRVVTGNGRGNEVRTVSGANGQIPANDRFVLRSFSLYYDPVGAQNLLSAGVQLERAASTGRTPGELVAWEDNDRAEGIRWQVTYLPLK